MKKILFIILFLISLSALGQRNTLYVTLQPTDMGLGLRYDRQINDIGFYTSGSWGNYELLGKSLLSYGYIRNHVKIAFGGMIYLSPYTFITLGTSWHHYGKRQYCEIFNGRVFDPVSFEAGAGVRLGWFSSAFRFDYLKNEGCFEFGVNF